LRPDTSLFLAVNGLAGHSPALDLLMLFFAEALVYFVPAVIFALWHGRNDMWKKITWGSLASFGVSSLLSALLGLPRPGALGVGRQLVSHKLNGSFPSDHTALMFGAAFSARKNKKLFVLLLIFATLTGFARIFVGVHFPLDIIGGAVLGAAVPFLLDKVSEWR